MKNDLELKHFHWIKLKKDFMSSDEVDFLMSQKNGANYVVLYQMLCLMTIQSIGRLERQINEVIIPYDVEKIQRDTKYFDIDTVRIALELFKKLGLIYIDENSTLVIANYHELIGGESASAERVRKHRKNKKALQCNTNVTQQVTSSNATNELQSNTYIELELESELDIKKDINNVVVVNNISTEDLDNNNNDLPINLIEILENEISRPLTPFEMESLFDFQKRHSDEVIKFAIKQMILNGKRNIGYLRSILANYHASSLKTVDEIIEHEENRKKYLKNKNIQTMVLPDYYSSSPPVVHREDLDINKEQNIHELKERMKKL